jgi:hypothetical protein
LPAPAVIGAQDGLGEGPVVTVGQLVAVQEFPEPAALAEHEDTPVDEVTSTQLVCVYELPLLAGCEVQEATPTGTEVVVAQVVLT